MSRVVVETKNLCKSYFLGKEELPILHNIDFVVREGEYLSMMGQSGAGKSTLLNILGCLDRPTSGEYLFHNKNIANFSDAQRADLRNSEIGFVFQNFNLLPKLTVFGNVELPLIYANVRKKKRKDMVKETLTRFGLWDRRDHHPNEISGGQKQRVAIARALVKRPAILFADEPTGNLDSHTTHEILAIFDELSQEGNSIITITHEDDVAVRASRQITVIDGRIHEN